MKFGGTSVGKAQAIRQVVSIIRKNLGKRPVIITSALAHVTNLLLEIADKKSQKNLAEIEKKHFSVLRGFSRKIQELIFPRISELINELRKTAKKLVAKEKITKKDKDLLASFGERLSSWLLTGALMNAGISSQRIDSRELISTNSAFGNAEVNEQKTKQNFIKKIAPLVKKNIVPVITGFIGRDKMGNVTTLGRGGSDYSAAIAAMSLNAKEIQIWKDVPGFMTADPRIIKNAKIIDRLSFQEAAELSYFGAKVIHPKTIHPAVKKNIPVRILNTFAPDSRGTLILGAPAEVSCSIFPVQAISYKKNVTVINVSSLRMLGPYGFLERLFRIFSEHRTPVDVVATSEVSVSMTIEDSSLRPGLINNLKKIGIVELKKSYVILSLVGACLKEDPRVESSIFEVFQREKIPTEMISKGASAINFTCIIEEQYFNRALYALHNKFFNHSKK